MPLLNDAIWDNGDGDTDALDGTMLVDWDWDVNSSFNMDDIPNIPVNGVRNS